MMLPMDLGKQYAANTATIEEAGAPGRKLMQTCAAAKPNPYASGTPPAGVNWVTASKQGLFTAPTAWMSVTAEPNTHARTVCMSYKGRSMSLHLVHFSIKLACWSLWGHFTQ